MSNRKAAAVIAVAVLAIGLVIGFWQLSIDREYRTDDGRTDVSCGSAFGGLDDDADAAEFGGAIRDAYAGGDGTDNGGYVDRCQEKLASQRLIALVVVGLGALGLAWLALTSSATGPTQLAETQPSDDATT